MANKGQEHKTKTHRVEIRSGRPMEMIENEELPLNISKEQLRIGEVVGPTMRAYVGAAKELLDGKHSSIRDYAPLHLRQPSTVIAFCCKDGIIIRYESNSKQQKTKVGIGYIDETLSEFAPKISEAVVRCRVNRAVKPGFPENSPEIIISSTSGDTGIQKDIVRIKVSFDSIIEQPSGKLHSPPAKPYCILSVRNYFEIGLEIETIPDGDSLVGKNRFVTRTPLRLPVGWECIEIFPFTDVSYWKPEYASIWAENDLLASVVAAQFREQQYRNLDPNAIARAEFEKLLTEYKQLLDSEPEREEVLQSFLKEHPLLLCPTQVRMKPKLPIGKNITDFVFQDANGDYLLVELEPSTDTLFIKSGDTSAKLNHAKNQIVDWRRYIEDNLPTVQKELDLPGISASPRGLIVIGRSHSLSPENRRKLVSIENESPKTKIITYDDVFVNTKTMVENLLGPLWFGTGTTEVYFLKD